MVDQTRIGAQCKRTSHIYTSPTRPAMTLNPDDNKAPRPIGPSARKQSRANFPCYQIDTWRIWTITIVVHTYIDTEYKKLQNRRTAKLPAFRTQYLAQMPPIAAVTGNLTNSELPSMCISQENRRFKSSR